MESFAPFQHMQTPVCSKLLEEVSLLRPWSHKTISSPKQYIELLQSWLTLQKYSLIENSSADY